MQVINWKALFQAKCTTGCPGNLGLFVQVCFWFQVFVKEYTCKIPCLTDITVQIVWKTPIWPYHHQPLHNHHYFHHYYLILWPYGPYHLCVIGNRFLFHSSYRIVCNRKDCSNLIHFALLNHHPVYKKRNRDFLCRRISYKQYRFGTFDKCSVHVVFHFQVSSNNSVSTCNVSWPATVVNLYPGFWHTIERPGLCFHSGKSICIKRVTVVVS